MTVKLPPNPTLERLAGANPVPVDDQLGRSPGAQDALTRILAADRPASSHQDRRARAGWHGRRLAVVLAAALLLAVGGAVAATDPFGLFRSPNPGSAIFGVDPSRHVTPPTQYYIACPHPSAQSFLCGPGRGGQRYRLLDHVESNTPALSRASMLAALRLEVRRGQLSAQAAKRLERDIAAVSDHFIARLNVLFRFGTFSTNLTSGGPALAPPPGVPSLLICEPAGAALRCRDMNGDDSAAVGSGIYEALQAPDWRPAPPQQPDPSGQLELAILGHRPTAAEQRLLIDLLTYATTSSSSAGSKPARVR